MIYSQDLSDSKRLGASTSSKSLTGKFNILQSAHLPRRPSEKISTGHKTFLKTKNSISNSDVCEFDTSDKVEVGEFKIQSPFIYHSDFKDSEKGLDNSELSIISHISMKEIANENKKFLKMDALFN